jgi:hypothetical protein
MGFVQEETCKGRMAQGGTRTLLASTGNSRDHMMVPSQYSEDLSQAPAEVKASSRLGHDPAQQASWYAWERE